MLDPICALAFEMHAGKGMFALLLGSGLSRTAKIPTGWDITLDLVRRVAGLRDEDAGADPSQWYEKTFGRAPDYSDLLDRLATTPTLRQQVMRPYIEPTADERARGEKLPTTAHHAIARLMAGGHIRVVLTTNFDQLLEQALAELGVKATVISSADQVAGALPLVHAGPMILKLHGDYLDTRIRNTLGELSAYEPAVDRLLDQVLDEFGLVVCGWSGEWDVALRAAIDRSPSRRFPMVWAARGEPGAGAQALIQRRAGRVMEIEGADEFFDELEQRVQAIETLRKPHPLSSDIAVAMLKEYLPEPRHEIRLRDLISGEFNRALDRLDQLRLGTDAFSADIFQVQVAQYSVSIAPLLPLAYTAGMWSNEQQVLLWKDLVATLTNRRRNFSGTTVLIDLRMLPATLVLYAFALGAVVGRRGRQLGPVLGAVVDVGDGKFALGDRLNISTVISDGGEERFKLLPAYAKKRHPGLEYIADVLRPLTKMELREAAAFDAAMARLELAMAFGYAEREGADRSGDWLWIPPGRFVFQRQQFEALLSEWRAEFEVHGQRSELCVMAGLVKPPRFDDIDAHFRRNRGLI